MEPGGDSSECQDGLSGPSELTVETVTEEQEETSGVVSDAPPKAPEKDSEFETLLEDVSRQQRERKAVKADDAAVPEYLWREHLMAGSWKTEWDVKALDSL